VRLVISLLVGIVISKKVTVHIVYSGLVGLVEIVVRGWV